MTVEQLWVPNRDYVPSEDRLLFPLMLPPGSGPFGRGVGVHSLGDFHLAMTDGHNGTVSPGFAFIGWAGSIYVLANTAAEPVAFGPADPANSRIDLVVGRVFDSEAAGPEGPAEIAVLAGQSAQTPVAPVVPGGAMALWEARYNPGATAPIVTDRRQPLLDDRQPRGFVAGVVGPAAQIDIGATTNALTLSMPLVAGRRYRLTGQCLASQQSATGTPSCWIAADGGLVPTAIARLFSGVNVGATVAVQGFAGWLFTATASGPVNGYLAGGSSAGVLRFGALASQLTLEDLGT